MATKKRTPSIRLTATQRRDLAYHEICRRVCTWLGMQLTGSTIGDGCSFRAPGSATGMSIPHPVVHRIAMELGIDVEAECAAAAGKG